MKSYFLRKWLLFMGDNMKQMIMMVLVIVLLMGCQNSNASNKDEVQTSLNSETVLEITDVSENEIDMARIDAIFEEASEISNMRNLSITYKDVLVNEAYYNYCKPQSKNNVFSVTKSITSMLVGIAIEEGYIENVNQKISDFIDLEKYDAAPQAYDITIHNLLTMSAGLEWNSYDISTEFIGLKASVDPLEHVLSRKMTFTPGELFNYSDGSAHLVAEVLYSATGKLPLDYANEKIFEPMGIENVLWSDARNGVNMGGCDLHLSCEDMQKIGQMVLHSGRYNEQQIVPKLWLDTATIKQIDSVSSAEHNDNYGYFWWVGQKDGVDLFGAVGHGGQFIYIVPEYELVITASTIGGVSDAKASEQFDAVENLVIRKIVPLFK